MRTSVRRSVRKMCGKRSGRKMMGGNEKKINCWKRKSVRKKMMDKQ